MEIECLVCGQTIKIPDYLDMDKYDGQISCRQCGSFFHIVLGGGKLRKYEVVEKAAKPQIKPTMTTSVKTEAAPAPETSDITEADVEKAAGFNPLRDYLGTYVASVLRITFDQIENIIGQKLETGAYTLKSWWKNDSNSPQAMAWLEAGWRVTDVDFPHRTVTFIREHDEKAE